MAKQTAESGKLRRQWTAEAKRRLEGRRITEVRYQTDREVEEMMWNSRGPVLVLDDGSEWLVATDPEGNGPGALHGVVPDEDFVVILGDLP